VAADDVVTILDQLGDGQAVVGGTGMGAGIAIRTALSAPERVSALILVSPEHGGEDRPGPEEVRRQQEMADTILTHGLATAWESWLPLMPPGMAAMVRDALPRAEAESQAAALRAIADQEPFERLEELGALTMPALVVAGSDPNHPPEIAERYASVLADATVETLDLWSGVAGAGGFAERTAPAVRRFLENRALARLSHGADR
jgi:pimeloyl-ACP methyl ester carboxylesterase